MKKTYTIMADFETAKILNENKDLVFDTKFDFVNELNVSVKDEKDNSTKQIKLQIKDIKIKLFAYQQILENNKESIKKVECIVLKESDNIINIINKTFDTKNEIEYNFWFHNGAKFDNYYLISALLESNFEFVFNVKKTELLDNQFTFLGGDGTGYLTLIWKINNSIFSVNDFYKIAMKSIKNMGKILKDEKLVGDGAKYYEYTFNQFNQKELKEYIKYCKKDVEILGKYFLLVRKEYDFLKTNKVTAASISIDKLLSEIKNDKELMLELDLDLKHIKKFDRFETFNDFDDYKKIALSYFGGYTNFNKNYQAKVFDCGFKVFDINSAYPDAMILDIPYKILKSCNHKNCNHLKMYNIVFKNGVLKDGYPAIVTDKTKKDVKDEVYYSNLKSVETWIWDFKLDKILEFYDYVDYEIKEVLCFKTAKIFKKFVEKYYSKKQNASELINQLIEVIVNSLIKEDAKLTLNSSYGKFGENPVKKSWFISDKELNLGYRFFKEKNKYDFRLKKWYVVKDWYVVIGQSMIDWKFGEKQYYQYVVTKENVNTAKNIIIASFITEKVRCKLFDVIKLSPKNWVYSDTDSVVVTDNFPFPKKLIDKSKLGYWDLEDKFKYWFCFTTKKYILSNTENVVYKDIEDKDYDKKKQSKVRMAGGFKGIDIDGKSIYWFEKNDFESKKLGKIKMNGNILLFENNVKHTIIKKNKREKK